MKWIKIQNRISIYNQWTDLNTNYFTFDLFKIQLNAICKNYRELNISILGFELTIKLKK